MGSSATAVHRSVVVLCTASIPNHSARSRDVYLSAATSFTVGRSRKFSCAALGSGWPESLHIHQTTLTGPQRHMVETSEPNPRLDRAN